MDRENTPLFILFSRIVLSKTVIRSKSLLRGVIFWILASESCFLREDFPDDLNTFYVEIDIQVKIEKVKNDIQQNVPALAVERDAFQLFRLAGAEQMDNPGCVWPGDMGNGGRRGVETAVADVEHRAFLPAVCVDAETERGY